MEQKYIITRGVRLISMHLAISGLLLAALFFLYHSPWLYYLTLTVAAAWHIAVIIMGYKYIIQPIRVLNKVYKAFSSGYLVYDVFNQSYELSKEHAGMMQKMNDLLEQKNLVELHKSQAEYMALQNQINPHFLYNTLEGIRSEALIGGLPLVGEMTEVLAKFFRYTISNVRSMVAVEDELLNVHHYCKIQQFRLGEKLAYRVIFEEGEEDKVKNLRMPKLILQPIVENAIRHGIEPLIRDGMIMIRFQLLSTRLVIIISDNGIGMAKDRLDELNEGTKKIQLEVGKVKQEKGGIALANVNSRIKLLFGPDYGLHFYSKEEQGTDVEITLPVIREKGEGTGEADE